MPTTPADVGGPLPFDHANTSALTARKTPIRTATPSLCTAARLSLERSLCLPKRRLCSLVILQAADKAATARRITTSPAQGLDSKTHDRLHLRAWVHKTPRCYLVSPCCVICDVDSPTPSMATRPTRAPTTKPVLRRCSRSSESCATRGPPCPTKCHAWLRRKRRRYSPRPTQKPRPREERPTRPSPDATPATDRTRSQAPRSPTTRYQPGRGNRRAGAGSSRTGIPAH
jgi:hypothetical protein